MSIEWQVNLDIDGVSNRGVAAIPDGLGKALEHIRAAAVAITPEESGDLKASATVTVDGDEGGVTFAGPYARYQHEGLDFKHERGGQAKFLETPMNAEKDTALAMIAKEIREAL